MARRATRATTSRRRRVVRPAGAWRRFFAALAALVVVLVGVPALFVLFSRLGLDAAHPFPGIGSADDIKAYFERDLTPTEIAPIAMRTLLTAGWALWLAMALSVVSSIFEARGSGLRSWLPQFALFAGLSRWIAAGLTTVSSLAPNFVSAASLASPRPFTISSITPEQTVIDEAPPAPGFARVHRGESIETFAQRTLGDADRWPELWELNKDQPVGPSGEVWSVAWKLGAGWDLRLPVDATAAVDTMTARGDEGDARPAALMAPVVVEPARPDTPPAGDVATWDVTGNVTVIDEYEVVDGDSFWSIAERFLPGDAPDRDVWTYTQALMAHNAPRLGYDHPAMIHPGDHIDVVAPPSAAPDTTPAAAAAAPSHTVETGDSYWEIAEESIGPEATPADVLERTDDLIDLNAPLLGYDDRRMIHPGDTVYLADPAGTAAEAPEPAVETAPEPAVDPDIDAIAIDELPAPRPDEVAATTPPLPPPPAEPAPPAPEEEQRDSSPIGIGQAALIATGIIALLAARRRAKLRAAEPPARVPLPSPAMAATERMLRTLDSGERLLRVDVAVRAAAAVLAAAGDHRITAVRCAPDGTVELHLTGGVTLDAPWVGDGRCWTLPSRVAVDELAGDARSVGSPCVALTQVGVDADGWDVLVDLEATGLLAIEAEAEPADAVVRAIAVGLASSEFAEVAHLVGVGIDDGAFLGHRHAQVVASVDEAVELAATLIGTTATAKRTTFSLRACHTGGEVWEPAVVVIGSAHAGEVTPAVATSVASRQGVAIVVAAPVAGARWTLRATRSTWVLDPLGLELEPIGIESDELAELVETLDGDLVETVGVAPPVSAFDAVPFRPAPDVAAATSAEGHLLVIGIDADGVGDDPGAIVVPAGNETSDPFGTPPWPAPDGNGDGNGHRANGHGDHAGGDVSSVTAATGVDSTGATDDDAEFVDPAWSLMVRLLGNVDVVDRDGSAAKFERSKTLELVAWLVTHRQRASRGAARTALWDLDVRDATFANVVSEARRAMARHVAPPEGDEWLRRTLTEELSLHDAVIADADIVRARFEAVKGRSAAAAMTLLRPAVELVRELPFSGTSYLWSDSEGTTSNLVLLATNVTAEYARLALAAGDVDGVFWATGRGLNVLAGQEALIGLRMRAHAAAGDLSGVRLEWEAYERVINADPWSDGEPAAKLVALRKELLSK